MSDLHTRMMTRALELAQAAALAGEVPVGAVVYDAAGTILAEAHNSVESSGDVTAHAEFVATKAAAAALRIPYLENCYVAVTLEPCAMCAQALSWLRVKGIYFGGHDVKSGGVVNGARVLDHAHWKPDVIGGLMETECVTLLKTFFEERR